MVTASLATSALSIPNNSTTVITNRVEAGRATQVHTRAKRWEWHRPAHFCTTARGYERVLERVCDRAGVPEPVYQAVDQLQPNNCYLQQLEVTVVATDSTPEGANHGTFGSEKVGETGRGNHSTPGVSGSHDITSLATRSLRTQSLTGVNQGLEIRLQVPVVIPRERALAISQAETVSS